MSDRPLESEVERPACVYAKSRRWLTEKIAHAGRRGFPDRYFLRDGITILIEFKRPDEEPTTQQLKRHKEIREHGGTVYVVDNLDEAMRILR
jgi:hypothetical protein